MPMGNAEGGGVVVEGLGPAVRAKGFVEVPVGETVGGGVGCCAYPKDGGTGEGANPGCMPPGAEVAVDGGDMKAPWAC